MGQLNQYNLGKLGVNVDKSEVHLEDGELRKAQNTIRNPLGHEGGIEKRPGLAKFNPLTAAGSIVGGIGLPLALQSDSINGTTLTGGPSRKIYWGRAVTGGSIGATAGWWTSIDKFASAAVVISGGTPGDPRSVQLANFETTIGLMTGMPGSACVLKNRLYYASNDYTKDVSSPVIRVFDGTVDQELVRIPPNPLSAATACYGILSMMAANGVIYLTTYDGPTAATAFGRVFSFNPSTGVLVPLGATFPQQHMPYALAWHAGRLWCGTWWRTDDTNAGRIYSYRPGIDAAWVLDRTMAVGRGCSMLISYNGELFAGSYTIASGANCRVEKRDTLGAWASSLNVGGASTSLFLGGVVFAGNLYVNLYLSNTTSTIRKFDGTTWTTPHTIANGKAAPMAFTDRDTVYFGGGGNNKSAELVSSTDGAVWTSRTVNLTAHTGPPMIGALAI